VVQPTEILDGAMIWHYWEPNYLLQNEVYIKELMRRHGKELEFVRIVFANNVMKIDSKDTMGMIAANVCKETFRADYVLLNKSGMRHCQLNSAPAFNWCQKLGMPAMLNFSAVSIAIIKNTNNKQRQRTNESSQEVKHKREPFR